MVMVLLAILTLLSFNLEARSLSFPYRLGERLLLFSAKIKYTNFQLLKIERSMQF